MFRTPQVRLTSDEPGPSFGWHGLGSHHYLFQGEIMRRLPWFAALALAVALFAALGLARPVAAQSPSCGSRVNNTHAKLLECVTLSGVREHQAALQAIADANNGIRVSGSPGFDQSVEYVKSKMEAAGYKVTVQPFQFQTFITLSPPILQTVAPTAGTVDNNILSYSGSGDVTASVARPAGALGCTAADWAGFPAGSIALVSRGTCTFAIKATNAQAAGAVGVIIYNNQPGTINGTLGNGFTLNIGVTSVTLAKGQELVAQIPGLIMRLKTDTFRGIATTYNVFADTTSGDPNNMVVVGAHLDSVNAGPGINDNGSGSAALLEIAEQMSKVKPRNMVRFAWWGAEESGLVGSTFYVNGLSEAEIAKIALYLNFDMVGSPNHVFFIYDGDNSDGDGAGPGPEGSKQIERTFERYFNSVNVPFKGTDFSGRSDYGPFIARGVPAGGLFTGAEGIKTAQEAAIWGGTAGVAYDPCYHLACDTFANNNDFALDVNSDAIAYATLQYGMNTADVNGVRGKGNFKLQNDPGPDLDHVPASE
jgi:aminopeptidase Y